MLRRIDGLVKELKGASRATVTANLIFGVWISAGSMEIRLDLNVLSKKLDVPRADIFEEGLIFEKPFQLRKRGVETKLVLGGIQTELDKTLIRNIVAAQKWFEAIRQGRTLDEVANDAGLTKRRILQMMDHAFLAPDIVKQVAEGRQPVRLTSEWLQRNTLPLDWEDQRQLIADL